MKTDRDLCAVVTCVALADGDDLFCAIHDGAKVAMTVPVGTRCPNCHRLVEVGEWITRGSTLEEMYHLVCPPGRVWTGRKKDRPKPLLETLDAAK